VRTVAWNREAVPSDREVSVFLTVLLLNYGTSLPLWLETSGVVLFMEIRLASYNQLGEMQRLVIDMDTYFSISELLLSR
jgi:hypothetical protein